MAGSVAIAAGSIEEALAHVEESRKENVDIIKLMITGGVMDAKVHGLHSMISGENCITSINM